MFTGFYSKEINNTTLLLVSDKFIFLGKNKKLSDNILVYKNDNTFFIQVTEISLFEKVNGKMLINIKYSFNPSILSWILGICFFPFGFLIFILPNKAKDEFEFLLNSIEL